LELFITQFAFTAIFCLLYTAGMTEFGNYLSGIMVDLSMNATEFAQNPKTIAHLNA